jgi:hypothetical protein
MKNSQSKTIKDIEKYMEGLEKKTSSQPYKPFFTIYAKKRHWLNPFKYIFGEYKYKWFEKDKQPRKYINAFEIGSDLINLDVKDILIK